MNNITNNSNNRVVTFADTGPEACLLYPHVLENYAVALKDGSKEEAIN